MHAKNCFIHSYKLKLSSQKRSAFSSYTYIFKEGQDDGRPPNFPIFLGGKFLLIFYGGVYHERKIQTLLHLIWNKKFLTTGNLRIFSRCFSVAPPKCTRRIMCFMAPTLSAPSPFWKKLIVSNFFISKKYNFRS